MKRFVASRAAFDELERAVAKAASAGFDGCDILVKLEGIGQQFTIREVSLFPPDCIAFVEFTDDPEKMPTTIIPGGQKFAAVVDTCTKSIGARIVTKFSHVDVV